MAPSSSNLPRPGRVLAIFAVVVIALYAILGLVAWQSTSSHSTWSPHLGLDLQGGTRITLQAKSASGDVSQQKLDEAASIIDQRVNGSGVSEAEVTTQGGNQIITEIPGKQSQDLVDTVTRTAQLRFRLVWGGQTQKPPKGKPQAADKAIAKARKAATSVDWTKLTLDQMIKAETEGVTALPKQYQDAVSAMQAGANAFGCNKKNLDPDQLQDNPNAPLITCDKKSGEVFLLSPAVIEGTDLESASAVIPQNSVQWVVNLKLGGKGEAAFDKVTGALVGNQKRFAIVLDGTVLSAPTAQAHITDGNSQISGNFTQASAQSLANSLKYGALPLTFNVNGVSVEGPSLAGTQLSAGIVAGIVGLLLVVVYSLFYYRGLGIVVIASLAIAGVITYALVLLLGKGMNFTLTLPGIAGLIVAIGITADSFIVFFERLRDEVRDGRSLRLAVEAGWKRARATILAADAVSFLAALILYIFAIGVVRGFAFALGLTTLIDVFVVFFFTKPLLSILARTRFYGRGHKLSGLDASHLGIEGRSVTQTAKSPGAARTSEGSA
ncbi:MAG: protein translocase subunit SecD [Nocardioidaceae bacterium]